MKLRRHSLNLAWKLFLVNHFKVISILCLLFHQACLKSNPAPYYEPNLPAKEIGTLPPLPPVTAEDEKFGQELLAELSQKYPLDFNHPRRSEVDEVVKKLTDSIGGAQFPWHVNVFSDHTVKNAAATRGNNIFIWTGMLDATNNQDELAAVLGHEIGHILANHTQPTSGETAREVLVGIGSMAAGMAVTILTNGAMGSDIASRVAASLTKEVGSGILIYPYTREKESEADELGIFLMAKAGFNPQSAIDFWTRAEKDPDFSSSIPFFSTHPPAADRLEHLKKLLPIIEEQKKQAKNGKSITSNHGALNYPQPTQNTNSKSPSTIGNNLPNPVNQSNQNSNKLPDGDSFDIRK